MYSIDYIMSLLDWNRSTIEQNTGIELAGAVRCINVFIQPCDIQYNKNVWDNCAKILSKRTDEELTPYLFLLFAWLQDMNWPGAIQILYRLREYKQASFLEPSLKMYIKMVKATKNKVWLANLREIKKPKHY